MSHVLEERVMQCHPLAPAHRMVLFMVARSVPDGQTEVVVNRAALARVLDAHPREVAHALIAGERAGLCQTIKGRVAFTAYDSVLGETVVPTPNGRPAVTDAPPTPMETRPTIRQVMAEFARQWEEHYHQRYVFREGVDHKLAKKISAVLTSAEVSRFVVNYLHSPEEFYGRCMHAFSYFERDIHKFGGRGDGAPKSRIRDASATQDYLRELRGGGDRAPRG